MKILRAMLKTISESVDFGEVVLQDVEKSPGFGKGSLRAPSAEIASRSGNNTLGVGSGDGLIVD